MSNDLCYLTAAKLIAAYRDKHLSPVEVTRAVLDRIGALNPRINAFFFVDAAGALAAARAAEARWAQGQPLSELDGVPVSLKDHFLTAGMPSPWGTRAIGMEGPWTKDAPVTARLKEGGAVLLGKTTMPEMGYFCSTVSLLYGVCRNPWDLQKTPGGSSGGAAAAVVSGMGPIAVGSDGGGSIRIPASYSGIFGYKPSYGRVPFYPFAGLSTVAGPLTRSVADAALVMNVITKPDHRDFASLPYDNRDYRDGLEDGMKGLKMAFCPTFGYGTPVDPEVAALVKQATDHFAILGAHVEEVASSIPTDPSPLLAKISAAGLSMRYKMSPEDKRDLWIPALLEHAKCGAMVTTEEVFASSAFTFVLRQRLANWFKAYDLLLTPTMPTPAFGAEELFPAYVERDECAYALDHTPFTYPFSLSEQPAASLPCGFTQSGLPVGLQIVGRRHHDALVLRASRTYEAVCPIVERWPAL